METEDFAQDGEAIMRLVKLFRTDYAGSREIALVITKLQEAFMWLNQAALLYEINANQGDK